MDITTSVPPKAPNVEKNVINLKTILDIRGKLMNEFHKDMKNTAQRIKKTETNDNTVAVANLNNTFTVVQDVNAATKKKSENNNKINKKQVLSKTIEPVVSPLHLQNASSKIPRFKSNYSPLKSNKTTEKHQKVDLNEIRERVIRRKFGYLWCRKVYGRILPSIADKNSNISFIRQYFHVWKNQWWYSSREWRLNVKAECFFNYNLYKNVWNQWSKFVINSRKENKTLNLAIDHYSRKEKKYYLQIWKQFSKEHKIKKLNLNKIKEQNDHLLMRIYYTKWHNSLKLHLKFTKLEDTAIKHFKFVQMSKVYVTWKNKYECEFTERRKLKLAIVHHKKSLLIKCLHSFIIYTKYRRKKNIQKAKLDEYYESQLVYRLFQKWKVKYDRRKAELEMNAQIEAMQKRVLIVYFYENWKHAYHYKQYLAFKEQQSCKLYEKRIKLKVLNALLLNHRYESRVKSDEIKALNFNSYWVEKHALNKWKDRFEEKEDIKLMHLFYKARAFHENFLLKSCYHKWNDKLRNTMEFNNEFNKIDKFYNTKLSAKYFGIMKKYVQVTKYKRVNYEKAIKQHEFNVFYSVFKKWYDKYIESIEDGMNMRIAILHNESRLQVNIFNLWKFKTKFKLYEESKLQEMNALYEVNLKNRCFKSWTSFINSLKVEETNEIKAEKFYFKSSCVKPFRHWKLYLDESRRFKKKLEKAETFYNLKILRILFDNWRVYAKDFHLKVIKANNNHDIKMSHLKLKYFQQWQEFTQRSKEENYKMKIAETFNLKNLLSKIFHSWNTYTTNRAIKHFNDQTKIEEFQQRIQLKLVFRVYYDKWKLKKDKRILENYSVELAISHYNKKIEKNLLDHWTVYTKLAKKKKLLENQADWFDQRRLSNYVFKLWQHKYVLAIEENEKNNKAIIHWAWQLEKKCFLNWLMYINKRKMKSTRYANAINDRRNEILKTVVKSFIIYSNDSRDRRFKQLVNQKQQKITIDNQLELKYYHRWRENFKKKRHTTSKLNSLFNKVDDFERRIADIPGKQTPILSFTDLPSIRIVNRPQPRKPAFLLDSVNFDQVPESVNKANGNILNVIKTDNGENPPVVVVEPAIEKDKVVQSSVLKSSENRLSKPVLLPPSAFTVIPETKIISHDVSIQSRSTSVTTTFDTEMHQEMTLLKLNNENLVKKNEENYNLIKLKERLENLTMKKEKLKNMKEQEILLEKYTSSADTQNISLSETLYQELEQIRKEINALQQFIKIEKKELSVLLKQYKLT